ncbi:MAG: hypothetical protein AB8G15_13685 [Saprospiraceae bacterium]
MRLFFLTCCFCFLLSSCDNQPACSLGDPVAIFQPTMGKVMQHSFKLTTQNSQESVVFENGISLELFQTGCEQIKQEFQFQIKGDYQEMPPEFWIEASASQFQYMSKVSESLMSFQLWGQSIMENAANIKLGERFALGPGFYIKIDKVSAKEQSILNIELSQGE